MVGLRLCVPVGGKSAEVFSALALDLKLAPNLDGYVPAVSLVYQVFEGNHQIVGAAAFALTVIVVVDGNKADAKERKNLLNVFPGVQVIASEPAQILHDHAVGPALPDVVQHFLEGWSFKGRTGKSVVDSDGVLAQLWMLCHIVADQVSLTGDTVGFLLVSVLAGQSQVQRHVPYLVGRFAHVVSRSFCPSSAKPKHQRALIQSLNHDIR